MDVTGAGAAAGVAVSGAAAGVAVSVGAAVGVAVAWTGAAGVAVSLGGGGGGVSGSSSRCLRALPPVAADSRGTGPFIPPSMNLEKASPARSAMASPPSPG